MAQGIFTGLIYFLLEESWYKKSHRWLGGCYQRGLAKGGDIDEYLVKTPFVTNSIIIRFHSDVKNGSHNSPMTFIVFT